MRGLTRISPSSTRLPERTRALALTLWEPLIRARLHPRSAQARPTRVAAGQEVRRPGAV